MENGNSEDTDPPADSSKPGNATIIRLRRIFESARSHFPLRRVGIACGALLVLFCAYIGYLIPTTPSIEDLQHMRTAQPSILLAADGRQLTTFSRGQQERVKLSQISPYVIEALIATEDHRFYEHHGVDFKRTVAAMFHTAGGNAQGGSTITQQLARNLFPEEIGHSRNLHRKMKEMVTAFKLERSYSKAQILETYLNTVPFLYNTFGIEMAARTYYDKPAVQLDVLESATLIGMLKGTSYYNPLGSPERAQTRRNVVLRQMVKHNDLSAADYQRFREQSLHLHFSKPADESGPATHFAAHVRKWLIEWADKNDYDLYADGLVVHTTIDFALQEAALHAVERQADALQDIADVEWGKSASGLLSSATAPYAKLRGKTEPFRYFWASHPELLLAFIHESAEYKKLIAGGEVEAGAVAKLNADGAFIARLRAAKTRLESGFVAIDPSNGEVKAWVGSRDFQIDQFDHVEQAARQPGSTFKPIVYGAALESGLAPDRVYQDTAIEIRAADGTVWRPTDMSGVSGHSMTLREGLIYSKNTITAQVMQDVGLPRIISVARALGVTQSKLDPVPSLALGTSPVTLLEMVTAYSTIAHEGDYRKPIYIRSVTDRNGKILAQFTTESHRAMSADSAIELIDMMRGVVNQGTGQAVRTRFGIVADIAGKTGTTQNNTDGWFILMHPNLVAGAWVGFNDSRVTMRSDYWGQGGHNAILIVGDFFKEALKAKLVDVKAQFSRPKQAPPVLTDMPAENWSEPVNDADRAEPAIKNVEPGDVTAESKSSISDNDLGHVMSGMGRDPVTGSRVDAGRASGAAPEDERTAQPRAPAPPRPQQDAAPDAPRQ